MLKRKTRVKGAKEWRVGKTRLSDDEDERSHDSEDRVMGWFVIKMVAPLSFCAAVIFTFVSVLFSDATSLSRDELASLVECSVHTRREKTLTLETALIGHDSLPDLRLLHSSMHFLFDDKRSDHEIAGVLVALFKHEWLKAAQLRGSLAFSDFNAQPRREVRPGQEHKTEPEWHAEWAALKTGEWLGIERARMKRLLLDRERSPNTRVSEHSETEHSPRLELFFNERRKDKSRPKHQKFDFYQASVDGFLLSIGGPSLDPSSSGLECESRTQRKPSKVGSAPELRWVLQSNKYPIGNYSSLLIPRMLFSELDSDQRPPVPDQCVCDIHSLSMALRMAHLFSLSSDPDRPHSRFKFGFNSRGAMASVDHYHWQLFDHLSPFGSGFLPVESVFRRLSDSLPNLVPAHHPNRPPFLASLRVLDDLSDYPMRVLIFSLLAPSLSDNGPSQWLLVARPLFECIRIMNERHIPFSLLIDGLTVYVYPRRPNDRSTSDFSVLWGFIDVSGLVTVLDSDSFGRVRFEQLASEMRNKVTLDSVSFQQLTLLVRRTLDHFVE